MNWYGILLALAAQAAAAPQPFTLPAPTGPSRVGTTRWVVVDESREETFEPGRRREVDVIAWYPTSASAGTFAPYLRQGLAGVRSFGVQLRSVNAFDALEAVRTHAFLDAPISGRGQLPLLLFSHGYTAPPDAYAALAEDLASHGFVVVSIVHPFEAAGATLRDRRVVSMLDADDKLRPQVAGVFGEWGQEDATMAAVTQSTDRQEQRRLLRRYLDGLAQTSIALRRWVDDVRAVVDLWPGTKGSVAASLRTRVDRSRFGVFGHSMGGVTSGEFCLRDARCRAVLNLDGIPQYGGMVDQKLKRPLMMVYSARPGRLGASDPIYAPSASPYYRADVAQTLHLDFSDMVLWPALRERHATGAIDPVRAVAITRTLVRDFFRQELQGTRSPILSGAQVLDGVVVRRY
jgi:pimeloyl-ACP methyl ester carboxylesterase